MYDEIVLLGRALPDPRWAQRDYLWRQMLVDGQVELVQFMRCSWVHGSVELRLLTSGCWVDGEMDEALALRRLQGMPMERLIHSIFFWTQAGKVPRSPDCPLCRRAPRPAQRLPRRPRRPRAAPARVGEPGEVPKDAGRPTDPGGGRR